MRPRALRLFYSLVVTQRIFGWNWITPDPKRPERYADWRGKIEIVPTRYFHIFAIAKTWKYVFVAK
jgi:hypothetical protein